MFNQGCRFEAGWEALLFLACLSNGALEEPEAGYGSLVEGVEASQLLALIRQAREKLEVNLQDAGAPPLVVSKDYRIYRTLVHELCIKKGYGSMERVLTLPFQDRKRLGLNLMRSTLATEKEVAKLLRL